ncbi:hypothetical protein D3C78_1591250 [compost metagenome]
MNFGKTLLGKSITHIVFQHGRKFGVIYSLPGIRIDIQQRHDKHHRTQVVAYQTSLDSRHTDIAPKHLDIEIGRHYRTATESLLGDLCPTYR